MLFQVGSIKSRGGGLVGGGCEPFIEVIVKVKKK